MNDSKEAGQSVETHGVLSATTGILMGDIGAVYAVVSYLLDRPAFTHELAHYSDGASGALRAVYPDLPTKASSENWQEVRDDYIAKHGSSMTLDPALRGVLADDKNPIETLRDMGFKGPVIVGSL